MTSRHQWTPRSRPGTPGGQRRAVLAVVAAVSSIVCVLGGGCAPPQQVVEEVVAEFAAAVQQQDFDRLFCMSAGAAESEDLGGDLAQRRQVFEEWARAEYDRYEIGRDEGEVELTGHGITLVKLFALGRGTFAAYDPVWPMEDGSLQLFADLRFGYRSVDLSTFSPGTTFYLTGTPVGTVHAVVVPRGFREVTLDVLEAVRVEWTLVETTGNELCPEGWAVAGVVPVEGSATTTRLTWVF